MKNTKKILSAAVFSAIILPISVSAMYCADQPDGICEGAGNGDVRIMNVNLETPEVQNFQNKGNNGKGNGQGNGNGKNANGQGKNQNASNNSEGDCEMELPEMQDLSDYEAERLAYQYSEEMLARDLYNHFYELYGVQSFKNVSESEQKHMNVIKKLLDRYSLETPTGYGVLQDEFDHLKAEGEKGLKEALEVGVKIEILDIEDIAETMRNVDNDDILTVYANIGGGSYNHMRGFLKALKNGGFETEIDYSEYLNEEEVNSKGGVLKSKLAEKLEAEGIVLPENANSKAIAEKMENSSHGNGNEEISQNGEKKGNGKNQNNSEENNEEKGFFGKMFSALIFWR